MEAEPPPVEERRRLREELSEFVESCRRTLEEVTASLGWSLDRLEPGEEAAAAEDEVAICPYDSNHHMPKSSLAKHMVSCRLRKLGYTKEEEDKMYNSDFFYENANVPSVTLNKDSQFQIIKQARAAVGNDGDYYNQIIGVIRDVISVHMEELSSHWQEEQEQEADGADKSEGRRSASVDSRQSGGSHLDGECSRHRRDRSRSPHRRKRNKDKDRSWGSRRRKERDGERHHSHKRRKQKM